MTTIAKHAAHVATKQAEGAQPRVIDSIPEIAAITGVVTAPMIGGVVGLRTGGMRGAGAGLVLGTAASVAGSAALRGSVDRDAVVTGLSAGAGALAAGGVAALGFKLFGSSASTLAKQATAATGVAAFFGAMALGHKLFGSD